MPKYLVVDNEDQEVAVVTMDEQKLKKAIEYVQKTNSDLQFYRIRGEY